MKQISINGKPAFNVELGHSLEEWKNKYGDNLINWDFPIEELIDGTVEPDIEKIYWLIDGRVYETDIEIS